MKTMSKTIIALAAIALIIAGCSKSKKEDSIEISTGQIFPKGEKITNSNFTGNAWLHDLISPDSHNQNAVGSVTFEPGARTKWHSHPAGQIILAIDGVGYYQEKGKAIEVIYKGQAVKCPHNIPHWHGASPDSEFVQVAITGRENGPTVWYEPVTDEEYNSYKK